MTSTWCLADAYVKAARNDSRRQNEIVFQGVEPNNILDPTVLPTLETIQGLLPSQVDSLTALAPQEIGRPCVSGWNNRSHPWRA